MRELDATMRLRIWGAILLTPLVLLMLVVLYGFINYGYPGFAAAEQNHSMVQQGLDAGYLVDNSQGEKDHILVACDRELDGRNARATGGNKRLGYVFVTDTNGAFGGCAEKGWGENLGGHNICDLQADRCSAWSDHGLNAFLH